MGEKDNKEDEKISKEKSVLDEVNFVQKYTESWKCEVSCKCVVQVGVSTEHVGISAGMRTGTQDSLQENSLMQWTRKMWDRQTIGKKFTSVKLFRAHNLQASRK